MLFKLIRLNRAPASIRLYCLIILGTKVSAREGVVPILIKSNERDLYVLAM